MVGVVRRGSIEPCLEGGKLIKVESYLGQDELYMVASKALSAPTILHNRISPYLIGTAY